MKILSLLVTNCLLFLLLVSVPGCDSDSKHAVAKADVYNENADAEAEIASAIAKAGIENKRVLLVFGANWCPWCHRLHELFTKHPDVKRALSDNYIIVLVDLGRRDKNMDIDVRYGSPSKSGIPALVVLDSDGAQIHTQETGSLEYTDKEKKGHDPQIVLQFLNQWKIS
ncbi:thioredoxin family protein [candidate division KSB1 bacterium]|nr:thioredoxin family protein [candidate division KSB1 bacterium]